MFEQQRALRGVAFRRPAPWRSLVSRACILLAILVCWRGARAHGSDLHRNRIRRRQLRRRRRAFAAQRRPACRWRMSRSSCIASATEIFIDRVTTDASGVYTLTSTGGNAALPMYVRVVNGTVRSSRAGGAACTTCVPVQTFRTIATSGAAVAVTDHVGGEAPGIERCGASILARAASERSPRAAACRSLSPRRRLGRRGHHQRHRFRIQLRHDREHARRQRLRHRPTRAIPARVRCASSSSTRMRWAAKARSRNRAAARSTARPRSCRADSNPAFS